MHWFGGFRRRWIWELGGKASLKTPTKVCNPPSPDGPSQFPLLPSGHLHKYAFHRPSVISGQLSILSLIIPWETTVWKLEVQFFIGPRCSWGPIYGSGCLSLTRTPFWNLTDVTLADEDNNSILTDNANRTIQGNHYLLMWQCKRRNLVAKLMTNANVGQNWNQC